MSGGILINAPGTYKNKYIPYIAAYSTLLFSFSEPVFGLVRIIHRCVQYIDFAEICHSKFW